MTSPEAVTTPASAVSALLALALTLTLVLLAPCAQAQGPAVRLAEVRFADLVTLDEGVVQDVASALTSIGALQITGIPRFAAARKRALEDLAECLEADDAAPIIRMSDGSVRRSSGAANFKGIPQPMSSLCGDPSSMLRHVVDAATRQMFLALDLAAWKASNGSFAPLMSPNYESFSDLMAEGEHLEHLHSYSSPLVTAAAAGPRATVQYHVDAGLIIAMTTGYYSPRPPSELAGLYLVLPDGSKAKAIVDDDAVVVLVGDGAARWLAPVLGRPLRAVMHALVADLPAGASSSRSWFGKMYLPPLNAVVPQEGITFARYHVLESGLSTPDTSVRATTDQSALRQSLPSACGYSLRQHLPLHSTGFKATVGDACPTDKIWCWVRCMDASSLPCGKDAVCWNRRDDEPMDPDAHCMGGPDGSFCGPVCPSPTQSNATAFAGYCQGRGTTMFMQGFASVAMEPVGHTACVNLLFPQWTLDSRAKFAMACVGVFGLCVAIQYVAALRMEAGKRATGGTWGHLADVALFGTHVTLGYFAMLVTMTYSVELFCMVCSGLTVGFALFHVTNQKGKRQPRQRRSGARESEVEMQPTSSEYESLNLIEEPVLH